MSVVVMCGFKRGFASLKQMLESEIPVSRVFVYPEDAGEPVFSDRICRLAEEHGIPASITRNIGHAKFADLWEREPVELGVVIGWRSLIPEPLIERARLGFVGIHDSLLPKYRGFAPTNWAVINGEEETGATLFYLVNEMDAGDIIDQRALKICACDDAPSIADKLVPLYVDMVRENIPLLLQGRAPRHQQDHSAATFGIWRVPADGKIDWSCSAQEVHNLVRGLTAPYPGAFTFLDGKKLFVWRSTLDPEQRFYRGGGAGKVERVLPNGGVNVLTGEGIVSLLEAQLEGGERLPAAKVISRLKTQLG